MAGALRNGATPRSFFAKEQKIEFQYDAINRLIHKIYIGKDQQIDYSYDDAARPNSKGMLTGVVDLSGTTDFWYDESGRAVTTVKTISGVTGSFTIERDYDAFGRMASLTYPDSAHEVVQYGYDQAGNLSSAGAYAAFSDYNALGQPGKIDYGNGVDTLLQYYDGTIPGAVSYRLESIRTVKSGSNRQWIEYAYDNNGNLTDITDNLDPLRSGHYIYNYRDMLGKAQVQDPDGNPVEILLNYGRTGNIESNSRVGSYTYYHSRPHAVRAAGANTYNYDYNGNMTTRVSGARTQSLVFDYENRLTSITEGVNRNDYLYDYTGARVKKQTLVSGAVTSTTVYIGGIYEQKDGVNIKHIFAGSRRVASRKGSSTFYFHPDHLGSLSLVTNAAGASYQAETYYPFGGARNSDPADPAEFEYKFTGQENDPETGLYYYGARYYDPEIGRFISPDSIVQAPAVLRPTIFDLNSLK